MTLVQRIEREFLEMPGLRLTERQAQRLCGADPTQCHAALDALVARGFLTRATDGAYARTAVLAAFGYYDDELLTAGRSW